MFNKTHEPPRGLGGTRQGSGAVSSTVIAGELGRFLRLPPSCGFEPFLQSWERNLLRVTDPERDKPCNGEDAEGPRRGPGLAAPPRSARSSPSNAPGTARAPVNAAPTSCARDNLNRPRLRRTRHDGRPCPAPHAPVLQGPPGRSAPSSHGHLDLPRLRIV